MSADTKLVLMAYSGASLPVCCAYGLESRVTSQTASGGTDFTCSRFHSIATSWKEAHDESQSR